MSWKLYCNERWSDKLRADTTKNSSINNIYSWINYPAKIKKLLEV